MKQKLHDVMTHVHLISMETLSTFQSLNYVKIENFIKEFHIATTHENFIPKLVQNFTQISFFCCL